MVKIRANVLIKDQEKILLMHRIKNGAEYFVLPGGSVESGESIIDAAIREAKEETGLDVSIDKELWQFHNDMDSRDHYIFLVTKYSGKLKLGGPEIDKVSEVNKYLLEWHDLSKLKDVKLFPVEVKKKVLEIF
ncbi:MAG: NUDIX domain-containing protein [bacterium]